MTTPQEKNKIATQTDETSNLGLRRQPLENEEKFNPIPELDHDNSTDYLRKLHICESIWQKFHRRSNKDRPIKQKNYLE